MFIAYGDEKNKGSISESSQYSATWDYVSLLNFVSAFFIHTLPPPPSPSLVPWSSTGSSSLVRQISYAESRYLL
jgi:hypothetical protein